MEFTTTFMFIKLRAIKKAVKVPVFVVGGLIRPKAKEAVRRNDDADAMAFCRSLIADPQFPKKIANGDTTISCCIQCNLCLYYFAVAPLTCYHGKRIKLSPRD